MASEISVSFSLQLQRGTGSQTDRQALTFSNVTFDCSGPRQGNVVSVGTSEEALPLGDVSAPGLLVLHNQGTTNYVDVYRTTGDSDPLVRVKAGQIAVIPVTGTTIYAKANTAAVQLGYYLF